MTKNPDTQPLDPANFAAIHARAQKLRADAMADILRNLGRFLTRGFSLSLRLAGKPAH